MFQKRKRRDGFLFTFVSFYRFLGSSIFPFVLFFLFLFFVLYIYIYIYIIHIYVCMFIAQIIYTTRP